jgi:hypothetical protein
MTALKYLNLLPLRVPQAYVEGRGIRRTEPRLFTGLSIQWSASRPAGQWFSGFLPVPLVVRVVMTIHRRSAVFSAGTLSVK